MDLNLKGREPHGIAAPSDFETVQNFFKKTVDQTCDLWEIDATHG